eukprot:m.27848 g.27848  ORF g.27848 m.27848 type:complete len:68 (+) comp30403_c0_seq2:282-485(+)
MRGEKSFLYGKSTANQRQLTILLHGVQKELQDITREWNFHRIKKQTHIEAPSGVPELLYFAPEEKGA